MKTVMSIENIELPVSSNELIEGKWLNLLLVSKKIAEVEIKNKVVGKSYRSRFHNSAKGGKYNLETKAGMSCINVESPMRTSSASLILSFVRV